MSGTGGEDPGTRGSVSHPAVRSEGQAGTGGRSTGQWSPEVDGRGGGRSHEGGD